MLVMLQDVWKRTVEIQISRSKSNDLTIVCGWYTKEENAHSAEVLAVWALCVCVCVCAGVCSVRVWSAHVGFGCRLGRAQLRQRIKKVVKFCMHPKRIKTHTRPPEPVCFLNPAVYTHAPGPGVTSVKGTRSSIGSRRKPRAATPSARRSHRMTDGRWM